VGTITAEANAQGEVRGYVQHPQTDVPLRPDGKLNIGAAVGKGVLHVIREGGFEIGLMEAYRGSVPLVSGEIAEDLTYYLSSSEQIPSAMSSGGVYGSRRRRGRRGGWFSGAGAARR
jgi:molecular chaperone Hsp33